VCEYFWWLLSLVLSLQTTALFIAVAIDKAEFLFLYCRLEHTPLGEAWKRVEARDHHGISVSLASLKSDTSNSGIGEFSDLFAVVDFLVNLKFDLLQLLPINDSSTNNPYKLRSSMALNPIYLSLSALPQFGKPTEAMTTILHKLESMERSHHFVNWNQGTVFAPSPQRCLISLKTPKPQLLGSSLAIWTST
jgi:hypothetical protein